MNRASPVTVMFAFFSTAQAVQAQTITKIAPIPAGGAWSSQFLDGQKGFVCGGQKNLFKTLDGGATWAKVTLPGDQTVPLYCVRFIDQNIGIVSGNSSTPGPDIFRTVDGGNTWNRVTNFPLGGSWYHQTYVNPTTGFMGCNGALARTTDAGASWQLRSGYPDCPIITGMDFTDASTGLAGGSIPSGSAGVFKTSDAGATWTLTLEIPTGDVIYLSPTSALATTLDGQYRSDDGGETWLQISAHIPTGITDIERVDADVLVGVSSGGDIWRSADAGYSWTQVWVGECDLPGEYTVRFVNSQMGTVVGAVGMYRTDDGGQTWTRLNHGGAFQINGIAALDDDTVITVGHHGYVQRMTTAGPWDLRLLDPPTFGRDTAYSEVAAVGHDFIYVVGHEGGLARSTDGGDTWQNLYGAVNGAFYANDVTFSDTSNGWMTGWDLGTVPREETYQTHDGGLSWQVVENGNFPGVAVEVVGPRVWIQSGARTQWRSSDGGNSFSSLLLPYNSGSAPSVADMSFATADIGYVSGYDGYLARSVDSGATWTQVGAVNVGMHNLGVLAIGAELWVCGARAGGGTAFVKRSLNQGQSWQTWNLAGQYTTPSRMVRSNTHLWVGGYAGELWRMDGLPSLNVAGDVNHDGHVDLTDLAALLSSFGLCAGDPGFNAAADFDSSGCVELGDLATLLANFGT